MVAKSLGSGLHRQVTEPSGSFVWALRPAAGMAAGVVRSAAPAVLQAAAGDSAALAVGCPCCASQVARDVAAESLARFCLMSRG